MSSRLRLQMAIVCTPLLCATFAVAQNREQAADQPPELQSKFHSAVAHYNSGQFAEASAELEDLLPRASRSFEVHELLGLVYAKQSQDSKAIEQLQSAVLLRPDSAAARTNLAASLMHARKPELAREEFLKATQLEPRDYSANHNLGEFYVQSGKIAEAVPYLEAAQQARPASYDNGYDLALAQLLTGQRNEARKTAQSILQEKNTGEVHNLLGQIDEKDGKFVEAANEFQTAARIDPSEDNLFVWASELLLHRTYEPAIDVFREAAKRYPESPRLLIGLGMALYSRGEYEKSIRSLLAAADLNPRDPRCYLFLSKAYLSSPHQAQDVIQRFRRYAELEPDNALAHYYYAVSLWKGRRIEDPTVDYQAVESILKKAIALDDTLAEAHLQLGILYNDQHEYAKSLPEYERSLQLNPGLPDAHFRLGQYYVHAGEKARAQTEFDLYKKLQAQHQAEVDKERADVQQFVVSAKASSSATP